MNPCLTVTSQRLPKETNKYPLLVFNRCSHAITHEQGNCAEREHDGDSSMFSAIDLISDAFIHQQPVVMVGVEPDGKFL